MHDAGRARQLPGPLIPLRAAAFAALLLAAPLASAAPAGGGEGRAPRERLLVVEENPWDFGEVWQNAVLEHAFTVTNRDTVPVALLGIEPEPGTRFALPATLAPGASLRIPVRHDVGLALGRYAYSFALRVDDPVRRARKLRLTGYVQSAYDPERSFLDFGDVERAAGKALELRVSSREAESFRLLRVTSAPLWLTVTPSPDEGGWWRVRFAVRPGAPAGLQTGVVRIATNVEHQPEWMVPFQARVFGDVVPGTLPVWFGAIPVGEPAEQVILLRSRSGRDVRVSSIENPWPPLSVEVRPCAGTVGAVPQGCAALAFRVTPTPGLDVDGVVRVRIEGSGEVVPIPYRAVVLGPGANAVRGEFVDRPEAGAPAPAPVPPAPAPAPSAPPPPAEPGVATLAWTSAREEHLYGYLVYRAERRAGPFRRVSRAIVRPSGGAGELRAYRWVDRDVVPGRTYFYTLETVGVDGRKRPFSGVVSKTIEAP